jgi:hypothetical protein
MTSALSPHRLKFSEEVLKHRKHHFESLFTRDVDIDLKALEVIFCTQGTEFETQILNLIRISNTCLNNPTDQSILDFLGHGQIINVLKSQHPCIKLSILCVESNLARSLLEKLEKKIQKKTSEHPCFPLLHNANARTKGRVLVTMGYICDDNSLVSKAFISFGAIRLLMDALLSCKLNTVTDLDDLFDNVQNCIAFACISPLSCLALGRILVQTTLSSLKFVDCMHRLVKLLVDVCAKAANDRDSWVEKYERAVVTTNTAEEAVVSMREVMFWAFVVVLVIWNNNEQISDTAALRRMPNAPDLLLAVEELEDVLEETKEAQEEVGSRPSLNTFHISLSGGEAVPPVHIARTMGA